MPASSPNIHARTAAEAMVTNMSELEEALAELEQLAGPVRHACVRAYRALAVLERSCAVNDDEAHEDLYNLSPAGAILRLAGELAGDLVEISGGPPVHDPEWVARERITPLRADGIAS